MPRPLHVCAHSGCPELTTSTRCKAHSKRKDRRPSARARGYDSKWERTRRDYLAAFPICQWHKGCISPATQVHHLDGQGPKGPRGHDWGNLQGLCAPHHAQITSRMQPGGWNAR